jgi:hypothetical protein
VSTSLVQTPVDEFSAMKIAPILCLDKNRKIDFDVKVRQKIINEFDFLDSFRTNYKFCFGA